jgi:hypothetical protein
LVKLRAAGFKLPASKYVKLKDAVANIEKLSEKAGDKSVSKPERAAAAKLIEEGEKIAADLVKQKADKDVCAQCELLKAFNL